MIWHAHQTHIISPSGKYLETKITPLFSICLIYTVPSRSGTSVQKSITHILVLAQINLVPVYVLINRRRYQERCHHFLSGQLPLKLC